MKTSKKILGSIVYLMLIILVGFILVSKFEKEALQKDIDTIYIKAISSSIDGLGRDYDSIDDNEKIQLYYKTLYNLETAIYVFNLTSHEEYNDLLFSLDNLHTYLLQNFNENYEIENKKYIYDFLTNALVTPEDNLKIYDFNK